MGEQFYALVGTVSGSNNVLTWQLPFNQLVGVSSIAVQRANFGDADFTTIATVSTTTTTYTDSAPEAGEYSYRLAVTVTQGGVDMAGTVVYSNQVNLSLNTALTLTVVTGNPGGPLSGPANETTITWGWTLGDAGANDDVQEVQLLVSINGGNYRVLRTRSSGLQTSGITLQLPTGMGSLNFKAQVSLPSNTPPYNAPVVVVSNVVSLTI